MDSGDLGNKDQFDLKKCWTLHLPGGETTVMHGYPQSLREVALIGMRHSDQVDAAMRQSSTSVADTESLCATLPVIGLVDEGRSVSIDSDDGLRCFLMAAGAKPALQLALKEDALRTTGELLTPRTFSAFREHSKGQEVVQLNIGGVRRDLHRATAERIPLLAAMLRFPQCEGENKPLFLDASPQAWDVLLEMARGRSLSYLESLEPSLRILVREYAEYVGMSAYEQTCFHFRLSNVNPLYSKAVNQYAFLMNQGTACTTGMRPQWNTVVGDTQVPMTGQSYWEVEITELGNAGKEFMIGVVSRQFSGLNSFLDSDSNGWGIYHNSAGAVFLRSGGSNHGNSYAEVLPMAKGTKIGILVDADRGSLLFFHNGQFRLSHLTNVKGQELLPALSVYTDAVLTLKTGLSPPV
eukprot:TRINITY_DN28896_c0_g1_i1.p1 TRINITY_DN28896_c0_g1~~TRINITY_DN28896_c0_g1_i1.p1  ORF type:complete len:409 (-),score=59.10 TRINITY_DN28896_c0_g1_i1:9-1235(-)